jgi:alpha-tubulin suppressor-like RCC1 family protein
MKRLTTLSKLLALALALIATTGCPDSAALCDPILDDDSDGLNNCEEYELGTAAHLADTDGDGISDYDELFSYGFSQDNNNYKFNPLIADTPKIRVDITSPPSVGLNVVHTNGTSNVVATEHGNSLSVGRSQSGSETNSQAVEYSETLGASVTVTAEVGFPSGGSVSGSGTVSYESSTATTSETSHTWSQGESQENAKTFSKALSAAENEEQSIDGGTLSTTVSVVNEGDIAYTLSNMALSAFMITPGREQILSPVGGLSFDQNQPAFPEFTYAPDDKKGPFIFTNEGLNTETALALMGDSTGLNLRVVAYELTDVEGRSFTHDKTEINARTATIIVDYNDIFGDYNTLSIERYQVATNTDPETLRISAEKAMRDILRIPFAVDENGALDSVRELASNKTTLGHWVTLHKSTDGLVDSIEQLSQGRDDYNFSELELKSGDILHLIYVADEDEDGLGTRLEGLAGTDPQNPDTDGDGLRDGDEVNLYKSSPLNTDSDGDTLEDGDEVFNWDSNPASADSDDDGIRDDIDLFSMAGIGHTHARTTMMAMTASGELWQWGAYDGRPLVTDDSGDWTELVQGFDSNILRNEAGDFYGLGANYYGHLAIQPEFDAANNVNTATFNDLTQILVGESFQSISSGSFHSLAIAEDGSLWSWGGADYGALGYEAPADICSIFYACQATPRMVSGESWSSVSAGHGVSFAIKSDGTLWAWGKNSKAQLGLGATSANVPSPTQVGTDSDWLSIDVAAGAYTQTKHVVALKNDHSLWSWGAAIVNGHDSDLSSPTQVGSDTDWGKLSASNSHTLAIKSNGSLWSWGFGAEGALGHETNENVILPTQVGSETNWVEIDAAPEASLAISTDHSLWTWGGNEDGRLGHEGSAPAQVRLSR